MALSDKQKWILGGTVLLGGLALYIQSSKHPLVRPTKIIYPPKNGGSRYNRIYQNVEDPSQLDPLLQIRNPLLLNFVRLGGPASNKITTALHTIVGQQMPKEGKAISMVSIECDNPENLPLTVKYAVKKVPAIVSLNKQIPTGYYSDMKLNSDPENNDVNFKELSKWVKSHATDIPKD